MAITDNFYPEYFKGVGLETLFDIVLLSYNSEEVNAAVSAQIQLEEMIKEK